MTGVIRWATWLAGALPGAWLYWQWQRGTLGVVPAEVLLHQTGRFALLLLMATLALGFAHFLTNWRALFAARRPLGVWTFLYALAHASIWLLLDQGGFIEFAADELRKMLHLQLGLAALLLMLPLALTSVDAAPRILGFPVWKKLHLLVWPTAFIAIMHAWVVSRFENPLVLALAGLSAFFMASRIYARIRHGR
ncbi:MAG: ferric reductase-like transmembrane domain-containing protein [Rhodobacteraceae bacterium]|nr:ferric reductase-like transmembrane domain-containing protein [Paracoccaceae bacterium]